MPLKSNASKRFTIVRDKVNAAEKESEQNKDGASSIHYRRNVFPCGKIANKTFDRSNFVPTY